MSSHPHDPTQFPSTMAYRGHAPKPAEPLTQFAQYRIVKPLGRGGMGVVYQAEDTQLHRLAALKVMREDYAADPDARARFLREAQAAARLRHDHIVTIYQVGEERGVPFLAMEFLKGKSLEDWLRPDRKATIVEALLIGKQIARGLAAAHAANLVHRDIKPANLWLEAPRGRVKILDFGLARQTAGEHPALTQDGSILGTPAYMAPEQARGEIVDHRCDLFSLGCVMYRILTGRLPFQGTTAFAVLAAIAAETPPSPKSLRSEIPERLSKLIDQLLAKKTEGRPESAQAVLEELVAIEQQVKQPPVVPSLLEPQLPSSASTPGMPSSVRPVPVAVQDTASIPLPTLGIRPTKPIRRKQNHLLVYLVLGGAGGLLAVVALLALLLQPGGDDTKTTAAENPKRGSKPKERTTPTDVVPSAPHVALPATTTNQASSKLEPLLELNTPDDDGYAWVSPDGLEIYFTREQAGKNAKTFQATRSSTKDKFGVPTSVNSMRHAVCSADGLYMVGVVGGLGDACLFESRRDDSSGTFVSLQLTHDRKLQPNAKSPWLSSDALSLVFQRAESSRTYPGRSGVEFVQCRRTSRSAMWSAPVRLPLSDDIQFTDALTWPWLSDDGLLLFFGHGGLRSPEVMYATRTSTDEPFQNPRKVLVGGQPLRGRAPRYVAATRELYLTVDRGTETQPADFDLYVLKDFSLAW